MESTMEEGQKAAAKETHPLLSHEPFGKPGSEPKHTMLTKFLGARPGDAIALINLSAVHAVQFMYSLAYELQRVALPFINKSLGGNSTTYAEAQTVCSVLQLIGGILFGRFGDVYGGIIALCVAHVASLLYYAMLWKATSITMLYIALVPTLLQHGTQSAQMLAANESNAGADRAIAIGRLSLSYGLGGMIGPTVGGLVSELYGPLSAAGAAALCELPVVVTLIALQLYETREPENQHVRQVSPDATSLEDSGWVLDGEAWRGILRLPGTRYLLSIKLAVNFASGIFTIMLPEYALSVYSCTPIQVGLLLTILLAASAISNGLLVETIRHYSSNTLLILGTAGCGFALAALALLPLEFSTLMICSAIAAVSIDLTKLVITSSLTSLVSFANTGTALGLDMALSTVSYLVCPLSSNLIFGYGGFDAVLRYSFIPLFSICVLLIAAPIPENRPEARSD
eukprot:TRINITY_DN47115_c0_g1_i1.p1 TRINITY_DN47115_c0_g1~~TRINITY_DN47115_c0_g1_i1.p1  ORF type:complete len:456 (+),score=48.94 TRINITY_DN47115_c0_g1_i1:175-1542(+)